MKQKLAAVLAALSVFLLVGAAPASAAYRTFNKTQMSSVYTTHPFTTTQVAAIDLRVSACMDGVCSDYAAQLYRLVDGGKWLKVGSVRRAPYGSIVSWAVTPVHRNYFIDILATDPVPPPRSAWNFTGIIAHSGDRL